MIILKTVTNFIKQIQLNNYTHYTRKTIID